MIYNKYLRKADVNAVNIKSKLFVKPVTNVNYCCKIAVYNCNYKDVYFCNYKKKYYGLFKITFFT